MTENLIEAILFVSGDGVDTNIMRDALGVTEEEFNYAVEKLKEKYSGDNGIHLISYRTKLQLCSNPNYSEQVSAVLNPVKEKQLTKATLETLSIIAYKQPITKLEIEDIRGVSSDYAIDILEENNLIEVVGRKDSIGKPLLFGTTEEFLKRFELSDITDLPSYDEVLDKIKTIESPEQIRDELYNSFEIPEEEEVPEFLQGEEGIENVK